MVTQKSSYKDRNNFNFVLKNATPHSTQTSKRRLRAPFPVGRAGVSKESQKHRGESPQTGEAEVTKP